MRAFLWLIVLTAALATTALVVNNQRASRGGGHCGCKAAKSGCSTPCSYCCGDGGMAACFANPDPTTKGSSPCCRGH